MCIIVSHSYFAVPEVEMVEEEQLAFSGNEDLIAGRGKGLSSMSQRELSHPAIVQ